VFVVVEDRDVLIGQVNRVCQPPSHSFEWDHGRQVKS
jgi:hypothetical protein